MNQIKKALYKDNFTFGMMLALLLSLVVYGLLAVPAYFFPETFSHRFLRKEALMLICVFINLFLFRYYMLSLRLDKTGRGILVSMFVMMLLYFLFIHS